MGGGGQNLQFPQAVPGTLPTPPTPPETRGGQAMNWLGKEVQGVVLPDESIAAIKRDPTSLDAIGGYANALMMLSGGKAAGERLPFATGKPTSFHRGAEWGQSSALRQIPGAHIRESLNKYDFGDWTHADLATSLGKIDDLPPPLNKTLEQYHKDPETHWQKLEGTARRYAAPINENFELNLPPQASTGNFMEDMARLAGGAESSKLRQLWNWEPRQIPTELLQPDFTPYRGLA